MVLMVLNNMFGVEIIYVPIAVHRVYLDPPLLYSSWFCAMFNEKAGRISLKTKQIAKSNGQRYQRSQVPSRDTEHCHQNHSPKISPIY